MRYLDGGTNEEAGKENDAEDELKVRIDRTNEGGNHG
jgi:hypothetical protein